MGKLNENRLRELREAVMSLRSFVSSDLDSWSKKQIIAALQDVVRSGETGKTAVSSFEDSVHEKLFPVED